MDAIGRETFRRLLESGCSDARLLHAGGMSALGEIDRLRAEVERLRAEVATLSADRDHARHTANNVSYQAFDDIAEEINVQAGEYLETHTASDGWRVGQPVGER